MRPQHITAENPPAPRPQVPARRASMRPQHITAENRIAAVDYTLAYDLLQ